MSTELWYYYDYKTREFKEADFPPPIPEEALPHDFPATKIEPPEERMFFSRVFNIEENAWDYVRWPDELIQNALEEAVQKFMDAKVHEDRQYDSVQSCLSYRGDPNPRWNQDAEDVFLWRSAVWTKCHELLNAWRRGEVGYLTPEEVIASLPELRWSYQDKAEAEQEEQENALDEAVREIRDACNS